MTICRKCNHLVIDTLVGDKMDYYRCNFQGRSVMAEDIPFHIVSDDDAPLWCPLEDE
jgi:hypothetical protein